MKTIDDLIAVMAALRTPVTGCPWDLEQTFATIAPYTLEEAYEVADAIARENLPDLKDELGDLLLQVVYHARMAEEQGAFAFADVAHAITTKMIRRHPHVFGDEEARAAGAAKGFWDRIKAEEKAAKAAERKHAGSDGSDQPPSLLDDVPVGMPGLTRALKLQDKAAKVGFDWPALTNVFDKLHEELTELQEAIAEPSASASTDANDAPHQQAHIEEEFGDLLFVLANVGRHLKIDPETALRGANQKFIRRFRHIEQRLAGMDRSPVDSDLAEMDALWDEAKTIERATKGSDPQV
ncbi:MAG: nucleoside triphosphate pyrophosphohydrolase [Hyphomicrobiaceae bacterium]|nr:nucleoside triphosphate pyrophosphohydrolase [Hyphomicrobiaceae bacterium]